jgi:hypothetical protein
MGYSGLVLLGGIVFVIAVVFVISSLTNGD